MLNDMNDLVEKLREQRAQACHSGNMARANHLDGLIGRMYQTLDLAWIPRTDAISDWYYRHS